MTSLTIIPLVLAAIPVYLAYQKENQLLDFTPRYVIVGFLSAIQVVIAFAGGSILASLLPFFFAFRVATKDKVGEDPIAPTAIEGRGNGVERLDMQAPAPEAEEKSDKIDNLF